MKQFLENPKDFTIIVEDIPNEEQTDTITLEQAFWLQKKLENENFKLKESMK